jgi:hypothetical protein
MKKLRLFGILALVLALAVFTGCSGKTDGTSKDGDKSTRKDGDDDHHDHGAGPHDGTIFDFGKWHAEFNVDHKTKEATVHILTYKNKPSPIQVEKLLLSIKTPQFQVDLKATPEEGDPAGKASRFVGKHDNFGKEQEFEGTLSGEVDGKPYAGDFKEEEHKDHKHEKK